jgi:hypothetical protein
VQGTVEQIRARLPASVATITEPPPDKIGAGPAGHHSAPQDHSAPGGARWLRVELRAEELHWLPPLLASLDLPFVIERPAELRDLVAALADRLAVSAARTRLPPAGEPRLPPLAN